MGEGRGYRTREMSITSHIRCGRTQRDQRRGRIEGLGKEGREGGGTIKLQHEAKKSVEGGVYTGHMEGPLLQMNRLKDKNRVD